MISDSVDSEDGYLLKFSALASLLFAVTGLSLGTLINSQVIMFDGIYSLVSLGLTLISLLAYSIINKRDNALSIEQKRSLESSILVFKGSAIFLIVTAAIWSSVDALYSGGRDVNMTAATIFGAVNVFVCAYGWYFLQSRQSDSKIIKAETNQWRLDLVVSVAVVTGFIFGFILNFTSMASYAQYADPIMMVAMGGYFLKVPLEMIKEGLALMTS